MESALTIQSVAERCGLSAYTLRYYERAGLIQHVRRASNGNRLYSTADETWVHFLARLRATGMSISQMQHYARLREQGNPTLQERRSILKEHRDNIKNKIRTLEECYDLLTYKIANYRKIEECPPTSISRTITSRPQGRRKGNSTS